MTEEQGSESDKEKVSFWIDRAGRDHIEQRAQEADVVWSHMARRMLTYAALNMPGDWIPPRPKRKRSS